MAPAKSLDPKDIITGGVLQVRILVQKWFKFELICTKLSMFTGTVVHRGWYAGSSF